MNIIRALLLCFPLVATAATYVNTNNPNATTSALPTSLATATGFSLNPSLAQLQAVGWRTVGTIESPVAGWAVDSYVVTNATATTCDLAIATQHNIQIAADAAITNSPAWTTNFVNSCKTFRSILRAFGTTETNAVVTADTMSTWLSAYAMTNIITPQLTAQFIFMGQMYPQILQFGSATTAAFPWRLIP